MTLFLRFVGRLFVAYVLTAAAFMLVAFLAVTAYKFPFLFGGGVLAFAVGVFAGWLVGWSAISIKRQIASGWTSAMEGLSDVLEPIFTLGMR